MTAYFEERSRIEGVPIDPTIHDTRTALLVERLYEEKTPAKRFYVRPTDDEASHLTAYTKQTGMDREIALLDVSTFPNEHCFPILWRAYVMWMHDGADAEGVDRMLLEARSSPSR